MKQPRRNARPKPYRFTGKSPRLMPKVEIIWLDACAAGSWKDLSKYQREEGLIECTAVGYLTKRDAKELQLVMQTSESGRVADSLTVPTSCVKRVRRLR